MATKPTKRLPRSSSRRSRSSPAAFPLLSPDQAIGPIIALSREVSFEMGEGDLLRLFHRTLQELLPNRLIAIRTIDPRTLRPLDVIPDEGLRPGVRGMPATVKRGALERTHMRFDKEASARLRIVDDHPLVFVAAVAGFSMPLVAGGDLMGILHIEYGAGDAPPAREDEALVIPIANHIAVATHMRRLLRETGYLQGYLEQLIEQASVLIVATDLSGRITIWNRAMAQLTGIARGDVLGRELLSWVTALGAPDLGLAMNEAASGGRTGTRELRLPSAGNVVLRAAFNFANVRGEAGDFAVTLAIGQDVTALRSLQNQVIHAEKLATVGQIAAGVAHEINNPLTSIQVCADALARKASSASSAPGARPVVYDAGDGEKLKMILEGAERIQRFARDLVTYARPSGTEVDVVTINEVAEQALSFCEHILKDARADVERDLPRGIPPIYAIRDQVLQVFINLVTNAADALGKRGGKIRIRSWASGEATVSFAVSDEGEGIREADRAMVFEPFFSTKPAGRGTGLGLSIVRNIVYSHGGHINFQTRHGGGTTFVVTLPTRHLATPNT